MSLLITLNKTKRNPLSKETKFISQFTDTSKETPYSPSLSALTPSDGVSAEALKTFFVDCSDGVSAEALKTVLLPFQFPPCVSSQGTVQITCT